MTDIFVKFAQNSLEVSFILLGGLIIGMLFSKRIAPKWRHRAFMLLAVLMLVPLRPTIEVPLDFLPVRAPSVPDYQANADREMLLYSAFESDMYLSPTVPDYTYTHARDVLTRVELMETIEQFQNMGMTPEEIEEQLARWRTFYSYDPERATLVEKGLIQPPKYILGTLVLLWVSGIAAVIVYRLFFGLRFMGLVVSLSVPAGAREKTALEQTAQKCGVKRLPAVRICPPLNAPVLTGLFRPVLLLQEASYTEQELFLLLSHELAHYKRRDGYANVLMTAAIAVNWFNPLVYIMAWQFSADAELACDEQATKGCDAQARRLYGDMLIRAASNGAFVGTAFSGKGGMKKRIISLFEARERKAWMASVCGLMLFTAVGVSMLSASADAHLPTLEILPASNQLVVYAPYFEVDEVFYKTDGMYGLSKAVERFKQLYPDVEVTFESFGDGIAEEDKLAHMGPSSVSTYANHIAIALMEGGGPDIFLYSAFSDVYKVMDSETFMDLSDVITQDPYFKDDDFNQAVMYGGMYNGCQYFIPTSYTLPLFFAPSAEMARLGFDPASFAESSSLLREVTRCLPAMRENPMFERVYAQGKLLESGPILSNDGFYRTIVDYESGTGNVHEHTLRTFCDAAQAYVRESDEFNGNNNIHYQLDYWADGAFLFSTPSNIDQLVKIATYFQSAIGGYHLNVLGNGNGAHATISQGVAIKADSPNALNAYNFIKILLSEELAPYTRDWNSIPVRRSSLAAELAWYAEEYAKVYLEENGETIASLYLGSVLPEKLTAEQQYALVDLIHQSPTAAAVTPPESLKLIMTYLIRSYLVGEMDYEELTEKLEHVVTRR